MPDRSHPWRLSVGTIAGLIVGVVVVFVFWRLSTPQEETSPLGEVTVLGGFQDGVRMVLNTDTAMSWKDNEGCTQAWIQHGEMAVSADPISEPVRIYDGKHQVDIADGSVDARLQDGTLDVTVLSGHARVGPSAACSSPSPAAQTITVPAGKSILIDSQGARIRAVSNDDLLLISGWQDAELVLNHQTLRTAVQQYNRYLVHPITIAGPSLDEIRVAGRFPINHLQPFLEALRDNFGIQATQDGSGGIALSK